MLLEAQLESKTGDKGFTDSFEKTLAYCKRFNRITRYDTVREVRRILTRSTMQPFEIAQVASLSCEDADEARALVPSLNKEMEYAELQALLMEVVSVKKFQS
ncbi:RNA polymerase B [Entomophthora muscae]|uniref:RNA polymerase B n=1 Tax=Entomophthora muscae TaxID=34485 RepID=A0ACC2U429_9FUNG|nr:RNA polymerase B [Entomophthora muscae]